MRSEQVEESRTTCSAALMSDATTKSANSGPKYI